MRHLCIVLTGLLFSHFGYAATVSPMRIDLGALEPGKSRAAKITVTNDAKRDIAITDVKASCGCTIVKWRPATIPPGGSESFQVEVKSSGVRGATNATIAVVLNTGEILSVPVTAKIIAGMFTVPQTLKFDVQTGQKSRQFQIYVEVSRENFDENLTLRSRRGVISFQHVKRSENLGAISRTIFTVTAQCPEGVGEVDDEICIEGSRVQSVQCVPVGFRYREDVELLNETALRSSDDVAVFCIRASSPVDVAVANAAATRVPCTVRPLSPDLLFVAFKARDGGFHTGTNPVKVTATTDSRTFSWNAKVNVP